MTGGKEILVETGKLAKQADGSVVVRMGDTMLLATVVAAQDAKEGVDFLPLTVDYREKYAVACGLSIIYPQYFKTLSYWSTWG